jgi:hypothetical protein
MSNSPEIKPLHLGLLSAAISIDVLTLWHGFKVPFPALQFVLYVIALGVVCFFAVTFLWISHGNSPWIKLIQIPVFGFALLGLGAYFETAQKRQERAEEVSRRIKTDRYREEAKLESELNRLSSDSKDTVEKLMKENERLRDREKERE